MVVTNLCQIFVWLKTTFQLFWRARHQLKTTYNGKHEYDYHKLEATSETTVHTLYFSDDFEWGENVRKTVAMQLVDTGNGVELIGINSKKEINYLEAEQLHILLRLSSYKSVYQITEPAPKREF